MESLLTTKSNKPTFFYQKYKYFVSHFEISGWELHRRKRWEEGPQLPQREVL